jgi:hypothetical protein
MLGMTLGLAALSAWGMNEFQLLTSDLSLLNDSPEVYQQGIVEASFEVFTAFFRVGAGLSIAATLPVLFLRGRDRSLLSDAHDVVPLEG